MTLDQALKSGRKFRRPNWYEGNPDNKFYLDASKLHAPVHGPNNSILTIEDLLANDYVLAANMEETVTLTRARLEEMFDIVTGTPYTYDRLYYDFMTTAGLSPDMEEEIL